MAAEICGWSTELVSKNEVFLKKGKYRIVARKLSGMERMESRILQREDNGRHYWCRARIFCEKTFRRDVRHQIKALNTLILKVIL